MFLRLRLAFGIICLPSYSQAQTYTLKQWDSIHVIFFFLIKIRRSMLPRTDIWDFFFFLRYSADDEDSALGRLMPFMKFCGWGHVRAKVLGAIFHASSFWQKLLRCDVHIHQTISSSAIKAPTERRALEYFGPKRRACHWSKVAVFCSALFLLNK